LQFDDGSFALFWYDFLTCTRVSLALGAPAHGS